MEGIFNVSSYYAKGGTVNDIAVVDSKRALPGDQIGYHMVDGRAIVDTIQKRNVHMLSGILEIKSSIIYGISPKGSRYYLFRPTDPRYPPFIVLSKVKPTEYAVNIYIVIKFLEWTTKYPRGNCEFIIGPVGIPTNEIKNRLYYHNLGAHFRAPIKKSLLQPVAKEIGSRIQFLNHNIISIDPLGCRDIDDALHCEVQQDYYLLGIHIADVDAWVPTGSPLDTLAQTRMTTIYSKDEIFHMLPLDLATNFCSLLAGHERQALSLLIKLDFEGNLISHEFIPSIIKVSANLNYDFADTLLDSDLSLLNKIITLCKTTYTPTCTGSHFLVEKTMILANTLCAQTILTRYGQYGNAILRTHYASFKPPFEGEYDPELISYMNRKLNHAAKYVLYNTENTENTEIIYHQGLQINYYTHFTSPIRRYIDILNHRLLKGTIPPDLNKLCDHANQINKQIRRFYRDLTYLNLIHELNSITEQTTDAYIIEIQATRLKVYLPKYDLSHWIKICDIELQHIYLIEQTPDWIRIQDNDDIREYKLYSKLQVRLVSIPKQNSYSKKLRLSLVK